MSASANGKPVPGGKNVLVEFEDGIAWVSLNRPEKRNAMSVALAYEMLEVLEALEIDDRCRRARAHRHGRSVFGRHGSQGLLPRDRRHADARTAARVPRERDVAMAVARALSEADDRDGQRLVFRRRVHAA